MSETDTDRTRRLIIASFWTVILIGLPLWWKTTDVYRAQLPFTEIEQWSRWEASNLVFPLDFTFYFAEEDETPIELEQLSENIERALNEQFSRDAEADGLVTQLSVTVDSVKWKQWDKIVRKENEIDVDSFGNSMEEFNGRYEFYIAPGDGDMRVNLGNSRCAFVQINRKDWNELAITKILPSLLFSFFHSEYLLLSALFKPPSPEEKPNIDNMRAMKYSPRYQITFSLMNACPSTLLVDWNIEEAVNMYLKPFLDELKILSEVTVDSQVQYYAQLTVTPEKNENEGYYYLRPEMLPHFVNSAEWNLASAVSSYPTLNLILYTPEANQSPLHIHNSKGHPIDNNAFLIPRWGGIVISNPQTTNNSYKLTVEELKPIIEIFISQLRGLLGVRKFTSDDKELSAKVRYAPPPSTAITAWELDSLIRHRTAENIVAAISTLKSLSQLVSEIPNMVVLDHIQTEVLQALDSLKESCENLRTMSYVAALNHAKQALERSESAFFDPTMVSMLYFPDEHKYAIYMPLFVPVSVPLLIALLREAKKKK
ncbi:1296_t:CDS:2 [Paraglomus brasilianum]|uniref:1296_t:CDS:1 n=1 Tax=Paraglomus brasilianum TaxID=144538 RepID=A0A9N9GMA0_9GLOM|nr:1296_t:CDS:2 [Paraglomus brasilianum]